MRVSSETKFLVSTLFLSILGGGIDVLLFTKISHATSSPQPTRPHSISTNPDQVTGILPKQAKPYTLVEFMDYQCPPCRASRPQVKNLLAKYDDKLQLIVRNFPLQMHSHAFDAAVAAEAAREQNKFWPMHDALLTGGSLDATEIQKIKRQVGLDEMRFQESCKVLARKRVQDDLKSADVLHLSATPTWILCTPEGKVWQLSSLTQV